MSSAAELAPAPAVAEMQGLYGPYTVSERVLQKIWLRGDFRAHDLRTVSGKPLRLRHPGRWNLQEGPDFRGAEWEMDGRRVRGDVEVHFHARDWAAHGHDCDPRYAGVALHVVLFPPSAGERPPVTSQGQTPEQVVLLDRLERDLEDYAADEALLAAEGRDPLGPLEEFLRRPPADRLARLIECALSRWKQKLSYAAKRIERDGWPEACHQLTLEALGYRRNRAPMAAIALHHPLATWPTRAPNAAALLAEHAGQWKLAGLRPANHPRKRLEQYARVVAANPHWPATLEKLAAVIPGGSDIGASTAVFRRKHRLTAWRGHVTKALFAEAWTGARLDTLVGDVLLPLASARTGRDFFAVWFHGFPGDAPEAFGDFLRQSEMLDRRRQPLSHGLLQGTLQIFLESAG